MKTYKKNEPELKQVDVIIPVYAGFAETVAAIKTAAATLDKGWARLVVINDASPDPELVDWLRHQQQNLGYLLLENDVNLGFVGTVNRGMRLNPEADVLLLNSDVEVANHWLQRLQRAAYSRERVASVTATANNATICSFPVFCEDNPLLQGRDVAAIDAGFYRHIPPTTTVEIPTGVGCCMYLRRDALESIGLFDEEAFGRGYGEENDWCQRAIAAGWCSLQAMDVFVYHKGSVSFAGEADARKQANLKTLNARYPDYHSDVMRFIDRDPGAAWRLRALIGLIGDSERPCILALSHGLGGGVKTHLQQLAVLHGYGHLLLLEPVADTVVRLWFLPGIHRGPYLDFAIEDDLPQLLFVLRACGVAHVHYHHIMRLPPRLWGLPADLNVLWDVTLHDYYLINANPTLTDEQGFFAGDGAERDARCARAYPLPSGMDADQWRQCCRPLLEGARYVICPSYDTLQRFSREPVFSQLRNWLAVPHWEDANLASPPLTKAWQLPLKVVVIGALSREKGADILESVAVALQDAPIEFHLLGYAYRELASAVITHGAYPEEECSVRLHDLNPDVVWFTALWPETYSYTLSAALHARLPVVAPAIGAFPERLAGRLASLLVHDFASETALIALWRRLLEHPSAILQAVAPKHVVEYGPADFYRKDYLCGFAQANEAPPPSVEVIAGLLQKTTQNDNARNIRRRILMFLLRVRALPFVRWMARWVPYAVQRKLKRTLSREPLHEVTYSSRRE